MVNDKMVNIMKKLYIQPASNVQTMSFANTICVGSVHGNGGLQYGGGYTPNPSPGSQTPM